MKKKLALVLSLSMVMGLSSGCSAADSETWKLNTGTINLNEMAVTGNGIAVDGNTVKITEGGDFEVTGTLADGMIYVNSEEKVKLRLSGANITNSNGPAIYFDNAEKAFITITENTQNYLSDSKEYVYEDADGALFSNDDLEIKGSGTLNVTGNYQHGIAGDDDVKIENGVINITSYEHGIKANDVVNISGGTITVKTETGKGIKGEGEVVVDGGDINIDSFDEGIESKGLLTINDGNINIVSKEDGINTGNADTTTEKTASENISQIPQRPEMSEDAERPQDGMPEGRGGKGQRPQMQENGQMPTPPQNPDEGTQRPDPFQNKNGKNQSMTPPENGQGGFGRIDEETAAAHAITINGGKIYINAAGDGMDSNGNLTINGGTVIIDGPENNGNGPLDSEGTMAINGGTVITASSAGMLMTPRNSEGQAILKAVFTEKQAGGTKISVTDSEEKEIMSFTPEKAFQALIFSSEELENEKTYTIYLNGEKYEEFTISDNSASVGSQSGFGGGMPGGGRMNRENETARNFDRTNNRNNKIKVSVNGNQVQFDVEPTIKNDTTLVGYRAIMEALGAEVTWDEEARTVTAVKGDVKIVLTIDSNEADVNGTKYTLLTAPEIINNSTMVPVRFISENLGMKVNWNETERLVTVDE